MCTLLVGTLLRTLASLRAAHVAAFLLPFTQRKWATVGNVRQQKKNVPSGAASADAARESQYRCMSVCVCVWERVRERERVRAAAIWSCGKNCTKWATLFFFAQRVALPSTFSLCCFCRAIRKQILWLADRRCWLGAGQGSVPLGCVCACSFLRHVFLLTRFCDWVWGCGRYMAQQRSRRLRVDFFRICWQRLCVKMWKIAYAHPTTTTAENSNNFTKWV